MIVVVVDGLDTKSLESAGARWAGGGDHPRPAHPRQRGDHAAGHAARAVD
jgi:hypothetical protein